MFKKVKGRRRAATSRLLEQESRTAPQAEGPSEEPINQEEPEFQDAEVGDEPPVESPIQYNTNNKETARCNARHEKKYGLRVQRGVALSGKK